jgi:hypothetical protein
VFERALHRVIEEGLAVLDATPPLLARFLRAPGWTDDEVARIVAFWQTEGGHPSIVHNYARAAASLPCYAIVLMSETETDDYLGHSEGAVMLDEVTQLMAEIEAEIGRRVNVNIRGLQFTFQIFVYTENPDVTAAYFNVLRSIFLGANKKLLDFGLERPTYSGMDLTQMPAYLPENVFARVLQVVGYAHILTATDLDLTPWDQLFSRIEGLHVANAVVGADARVHPFAEGQE